MKSYILITGGAGFIGTNLAHRYLSQGHAVMIYDSLARPGVEKNLAWLRQQHGKQLLAETADIRDQATLQAVVPQATAIFHFAAQVAVTTSVQAPQHDFAVNAQGTLNLLEAVRQTNPEVPLLFTSTNKVYGELAELSLAQREDRYEPAEASHYLGISETRSLDFHTPYGCSKGAADQYVLDYARMFGLRATVFRMSCIYGPHQFGTEDQGWVAHFLIRALQNQPITIYGDGKQVRDLLFVDDLMRAMQQVPTNQQVAGEAFNIGGGTANAVSLLQVLQRIEEIHGQPLKLKFDEWRPGDQRYYVSDTRKFQAATGWQPQVSVEVGLQRLYDWLSKVNRTQPKTTKMITAPTIAANGTSRPRYAVIDPLPSPSQSEHVYDD